MKIRRIFPSLVCLLLACLPGFPLDLVAESREAQVSSVSMELLRERQQLLSLYLRRSLELKDMVELEETKDSINVNLFVSKFFLPNSAVLQEDGLAVLNQLCAQFRKRPTKKVSLRSIFKAPSSETELGRSTLGFFSSRRSAGARLIRLEDSVPEALIVQRSMIVFSYLISGSMRAPEKEK